MIDDDLDERNEWPVLPVGGVARDRHGLCRNARPAKIPCREKSKSVCRFVKGSLSGGMKHPVDGGSDDVAWEDVRPSRKEKSGASSKGYPGHRRYVRFSTLVSPNTQKCMGCLWIWRMPWRAIGGWMPSTPQERRRRSPRIRRIDELDVKRKPCPKMHQRLVMMPPMALQ